LATTKGVRIDFDDIITKNPKSPEFSEDALALDFTARHENDVRYVASWGKWFRWDGAHWHEDSILEIYDLARIICRESADRLLVERPGVAKQLTAANTVAAVERLARWDQRTAATVDQWDTDPWLLNTPKGAVELGTGGLRGNGRSDYCTKLTAVAPGGECPIWMRFLERVTDGDRDLCDFLQRMVGYGLTGSTREEALFFPLRGRRERQEQISGRHQRNAWQLRKNRSL